VLLTTLKMSSQCIGAHCGCTAPMPASSCIKRYDQAATIQLSELAAELEGPQWRGRWRALAGEASAKAASLVAGLAAIYCLGPRGAPITLLRPPPPPPLPLAWPASASPGPATGGGGAAAMGSRTHAGPGCPASPPHAAGVVRAWPPHNNAARERSSACLAEQAPLAGAGRRLDLQRTDAGALTAVAAASIDEVVATLPLELRLDSSWWAAGLLPTPSPPPLMGQGDAVVVASRSTDDAAAQAVAALSAAKAFMEERGAGGSGHAAHSAFSTVSGSIRGGSDNDDEVDRCGLMRFGTPRRPQPVGYLDLKSLSILEASQRCSLGHAPQGAIDETGTARSVQRLRQGWLPAASGLNRQTIENDNNGAHLNIECQ
jgi:hypothetical protein